LQLTRVSGKDESEKVVSDQVLGRIALGTTAREENDRSDENRKTDGSERDTLELESSGDPSEEDDDGDLNDTKGHVEERGLVVVETETLDQKTTELSSRSISTMLSAARVRDRGTGLTVPVTLAPALSKMEVQTMIQVLGSQRASQTWGNLYLVEPVPVWLNRTRS